LPSLVLAVIIKITWQAIPPDMRPRLKNGSPREEGRDMTTENMSAGNMTTGTVKWFNPTKGYGFIAPEDGGKDIFVHISAVQKAGLRNLNEGQKLDFELEQQQNGRTAAINLLPQPG
jgi:CspA family cold shock protein